MAESLANPAALRTVRSKTLSTRRAGPDRFSFESALEDVSSTGPDGDWREIVHRIAIRGSVLLPDLRLDGVEAVTEVMPYDLCPAAAAAVGGLHGLRIGPGYRRAVLDLMGGTAGCTHFLTLALELAQLHTLVLHQQMREAVPRVQRVDPAWMRAGLAIEPRLIGACATLRADSPVILAARSLDPPTARPR